MIFENRVKKALKEGKIVLGPMVSEIRSPGIAVLFAQAGFDFFFIDMEHSCPRLFHWRRPKESTSCCRRIGLQEGLH